MLPWDDLNAKSPPERYLELIKDVLPTLAVLVAQGPTRARLLSADASGSLVTVPSPNLTDVLLRSNLIIGGPTAGAYFYPGNLQLYTVGQWLYVFDPAFPSDPPTRCLYRVAQLNSDSFLVSGSNIRGGLPGAQSSIFFVPPPPNYFTQAPPYQAGRTYAFSAPGAGVAASIIVPAVSSMRVLRVSYDVLADAATVAIYYARIRDANGATYFQRLMAHEGVIGSIDHIDEDDLYLDIVPNPAPASVSIDFSVGPPVSCYQACAVEYLLNP